jgi:hypothetical protein
MKKLLAWAMLRTITISIWDIWSASFEYAVTPIWKQKISHINCKIEVLD